MLIQLSITFIFQVAYVSSELIGTDSAFAWDMFGFLLTSL